MFGLKNREHQRQNKKIVLKNKKTGQVQKIIRKGNMIFDIGFFKFTFKTCIIVLQWGRTDRSRANCRIGERNPPVGPGFNMQTAIVGRRVQGVSGFGSPAVATITPLPLLIP